MATQKELSLARKNITKEELTQVVKQNDFLLMQFESFDVAKQWIEDNKKLFKENAAIVDEKKGLDYRWTPQYSKFDAVTYIVSVGMDPKNYTQAELLSILDGKKKKELKNVHYVWFQTLKNQLTKTESDFLVKNAEPWQYSSFPKNFIKKIDANAIENLAKRKTEDDSYYALYKMIPQTPNKIFALVRSEGLSELLERQAQYVRKNTTLKSTQDISLDFTDKKYKDTGVLSLDLIKYLGISSMSFYLYRTQEEDKLSQLELTDDKKKMMHFTLESVEEYLKSVYVNQNEARQNDHKYYMPTGRLYTWQDLVARYGAKKITLVTIKRAMSRGILPYFKIREKIVRYSEQDFENFLDYREKNYRNTNTVSRQYITFTDDEEYKNAIEDSFSDSEIKTILPISRGNSEIAGSPLYTEMLAKLPKVYFIKKVSGDEPEEIKKDAYGNILDKRYYRKDVEKMFSEHFGYLKGDKKGMPIIEPAEINLTKETRFVYASSYTYDIFGQDLERLNSKKEYVELNDKVRNGEIPAFFFTTLNRLILKEDADKIFAEVKEQTK